MINPSIHQPGTRVSFHGLSGTLTPLAQNMIAIVMDRDPATPVCISVEEAERRLHKELLFLTTKSQNNLIDMELSSKQLLYLQKVNAYLDQLWKVVPKGKTGGVAKRAAVIKFVSQLIGDSNPPDPSTLARWVATANSHSQGVLATLPSNNRVGGSKFGEDVKDLFIAVVKEHFLNLRRPPRTKAYAVFVERLEQELKRTETSEIPNYGTFCNWIKKLDPSEVAEKRVGKLAAKSLSRNASKKIVLNRILERVEVDALRTGVAVTDEQKRYLGNVILFLVIDCFSRAILGFQLQIGGGELAASVIDSYKHSLMPKHSEEVDPSIKNPWPMYGVPEQIVSDGGPGYAALKTQSFLLHAGIASTMVQTYSGEKKPFIESFNKTIRLQCLTDIPGYTPKNPKDQPLDATIGQQAVITLDTLKRKITKWIVDDYHQEPHDGLLGRTPSQVWTENAKLFPPAVPAGLFSQLSMTHGETKTPKIMGPDGHLGIVVENVEYNDHGKRLKSIHNQLKQLGEEPRVTCEYTPNDIHTATVRDPITEERFQVFAKDPRILPGMTSAEWNAIRLENKPKRQVRRSSLANDQELAKAHKQNKKQIAASSKRKQATANLSEITEGMRELGNLRPEQPTDIAASESFGTAFDRLLNDDSDEEGFDYV